MNQTRSLLTLACIAATTLALYGCGGDSNNKNEPCDGACVEGQICNEETNTCETPDTPTCTKDDDCTDGKVCKNQQCVKESTTEPECTKDDDCTGGKVCKEEKCVEDSSKCSFSNECDGDLICKDGECVPECTIDDDCDDSMICENAKCVDGCSIDSDCDGDLVCKQGRCEPECTDDSDCSGALLCKDNICAPECETDLECDFSAGQVCHEGECTEGCVDGAECENGYCDAGACVECASDDHCADNPNGSICSDYHCIECETDAQCSSSLNGTVCSDNHCVECTEDDQCSGTMVCSDDNICKPICTGNSDCTDSALPYCINTDQSDAAACVECTSDDQCADNYFCKDNACKVECEKDIDCSDNKKCDTSDNRCYECVKNADCGSNLLCDVHECVSCASNDADCDKIPDEEEVCPYNPNIKTLKSEGVEVECNYVTDSDGTKVFEIWHPLDFIRLQEEIDKTGQEVPPSETCQTPTDPDNPVVGECCVAAQYTQTCTSGKVLSCTDGVVTETACEYGCDVDACLRCTDPEDGKPLVAGNCCFDSFEAVCDSGKSTACISGVIVEEACAYGCNEDNNLCNLCNTPDENATKLKVGDCCNADDFAQVCSSDKKSSLQCIDGIVQEVVCEMNCNTVTDKLVSCVSLPYTEMKARLMQDINIADALTKEDIKDVPFETLKVAWIETVTDPTTSETTTVIHQPADSDYAEYAITDDTCVGRWPQNLRINLKNINFDGQNHRIFFKNGESSCSMVDSLFNDIENSYIHDLSINYNVRGLIRSTFANDIKNSTIDNLSVVGNINLETKPAVEEIDVNSYIQGDTLKDFAPYHYSIISIGTDTRNSLFNEIQYKGNITQNFTLGANSTAATSSLKMIPGLSGMFGTLKGCTVQNTALTIPDFVYTHGRAFVPFAWTVAEGTTVYSPKVDVPYLSGRSSNTSVAASFISGFSANTSDSTIVGDAEINFGNITTPGGFFYGLGYHFDTSTVLGDIHIKAGDMDSTHHYYGLADYIKDSHFNDIDIQIGSLYTGQQYFGLGYDLTNDTIKNIHIKTGSITSNSNIIGLADIFTVDVEGNIDIQADDTLSSVSGYYGLAKTLKGTIAGSTSIQRKNIEMNNSAYYGLAGSCSSCELNDITIKAEEIINPNPFYGFMSSIPASGLTQNGKTTIQTGNITGSKRFYGLAKEIKGSCKNFDITYGDITQIYQYVSGYTMYFSGLTETMFSETDGVVSDIKLKLGNVTTPYYFSGLVDHSYTENKTNKLILENAELTAGDITIGDTYSYKGDFDGLSRDVGTTMRNIKAKYGNIYIKAGYRGWAIGTKSYENSKVENVKVEVDSIISEDGKLGMVDSLYGSLENVAVAIYHLQSNAAEASAVTTTEANASIKNLVYYADVYSKTPISSGFINNIKSANLSLENIFSAARINQYTKTDETTHKATDGKVIHTQPLLFNAINEAAITTIDAEANPKRYWLGITTAKNVFWLKRDKTNDFATEKNFMSVQDELQFKGYDPNATEFALQSGTSDIEPANTLSGCANAASCTSPWAPANQMKKITEPNGETISIPWMK